MPSPLPENPHGLLNVHKPAGWTSHDVVAYLRRSLSLSKIGHAGTLDPSATGVLPVLIGKGTKIAQFVSDWDKEYVGVLRLGQRTDTQDSTGQLLQDRPVSSLSEARIRSAIAEFQGTIRQVPPMYSAVKIGGLPLYKVARRGKVVERAPRLVNIQRLEVLGIRMPDVRFRVVCSKGTYVRTLCEDIGNMLEVGGHLRSLERRRVGRIHLDHALLPNALSSPWSPAACGEAFWNLDRVLEEFPWVQVGHPEAEKVLCGNGVKWTAVRDASRTVEELVNYEGSLCVRDASGKLLAIGRVKQEEGEAADGAGRTGSIAIVKVLVER